MTTTADLGYSGNATQGDHYAADRYRSAAEIARLVRADIKAAVAAKALPGKDDGFVYRVRSKSYSGGQSLGIHIVGPGDTDWAFEAVDADDMSWEAQRARDYGMDRMVTEEARRYGEALSVIGKAYTREDVDSQVDYFNVSCYVFVYCGEGGLCL